MPAEQENLEEMGSMAQEESQLEGPAPSESEAIAEEDEDSGSSLTVEDEIDDGSSLDFLGDVPLIVSAELGRLTLKIEDLMSLMKGTVLELDKLAGEPLEIFVNNKLICRGEVIVINEKYGVRMTDIVDPKESEGSKVRLQG